MAKTGVIAPKICPALACDRHCLCFLATAIRADPGAAFQCTPGSGVTARDGDRDYRYEDRRQATQENVAERAIMKMEYRCGDHTRNDGEDGADRRRDQVSPVLATIGVDDSISLSAADRDARAASCVAIIIALLSVAFELRDESVDHALLVRSEHENSSLLVDATAAPYCYGVVLSRSSPARQIVGASLPGNLSASTSSSGSSIPTASSRTSNSSLCSPRL